MTYERNITKPKRQPMTPILVQVKDAENFWCNFCECITPDEAKLRARDLATTDKSETRVTVGPKRVCIAEYR